MSQITLRRTIFQKEIIIFTEKVYPILTNSAVNIDVNVPKISL